MTGQVNGTATDVRAYRNLPVTRHALRDRKQGRHGKEVLGGLRREGKDTVRKRDELRDQRPLGMKSGRNKVVDRVYKKVIMIQSEISVE